MEDTRVTFETAKLAKEKGFKWKSKKGYLENGSLGVSHYSDYCENDNEDYPTKYSAPTQSLLAKWLRKEHGIHIELLIDGWSDDDCVTDDFYVIDVLFGKLGSQDQNIMKI